jgi:PAS domain S-box-containing protein
MSVSPSHLAAQPRSSPRKQDDLRWYLCCGLALFASLLLGFVLRGLPGWFLLALPLPFCAAVCWGLLRLAQHQWRDPAALAEQALASSRSRLTRVLEATRDGVWEYDSQRRRFSCSDRCVELLFVPRDPAKRGLLRSLLHQLTREQRSRLMIAVRGAWEEGGRFDELFPLLHGGGDKCWLRVRASISVDRRFLTGAVSDVTEEIELSRERALYQTFMEGVIDALPLPVTVKGTDGRLILANRAYCQAMNMHPAEVVGKRAGQMVHAEMAARLESLDRLTLETGRAHTIEDWFDVSRAAKRLFLRITKSRCTDKRGQPVVVTAYENQTEVRDYAHRMAGLSMRVEAFVQRLIRVIPHPIYVKDADSRYLMANDAIAAQWGLRADEMIGMSSRELFGEEAGGAIEAEDQRILAGENVSKEDCIPDRRTGELRYWAVSKSLCTDAEDRKIIVGANYEITSIKRAEIEVREALARQTRLRQFLQQLFDALPHPLFVKDRQHRYLMTNRAHAAFHACPPGDIIGSSAHDHAREDIAAAVDQDEERLFAGEGDPVIIENEYELTDGCGRPHQTLVRKVLCQGLDGSPVLIGITFDVSDVRRLESELRDALARQTRMRDFLQELFDAMPNPVVVKDRAHCYVMTNRAFLAIVGSLTAPLIGKTGRHLHPPVLADQFERLEEQLFQASPGEVSESEHELHFGDGSRHQLKLSRRVCHGPDGEPLMIISASDVSDLRAQEQRLLRLNHFMQDVFNAIPNPVAVKDRRHVYVMANSALAEAHGLALNEVIGRHTRDFNLPEEAERTIALDDALFGRGPGVTLEREILVNYADGQPHRILLRKVVCRDSDGEPLIVASSSDITDLARARDALEASLGSQTRLREYLQAVFDALPFASYVKQMDLRYLMVNSAFCEFHGQPRAQLEGRRVADFVPAEVAAQIEAFDREVFEQADGSLLEREIVVANHRGEARHLVMHKKVMRDADGQRVIVGINQDLTAQRAAEGSLRKTLLRLDALIESIPIGIALFDHNGHFLQANPHLLAMLGMAATELAGRGYLDMLPQRFAPVAQELIGQLHRDGVLQPCEKLLLCQDGRELPVIVSAVMVRADDGPPAYWVLVLDQREQKQVEAELLQHRDRLRELVHEQTASLVEAKEVAERMSAAKTEFLAAMSHELKTPLHAVLSFAQLGAERTADATPERLQSYFQRIVDGGERLLRLLDALLDLARLDAGAVRLDLRPTGFNDLVQACAREFEAVFAARHLTLLCKLDPRLPPVSVDGTRMAQVLRNLLANALKFAPDGSTVGVETHLCGRQPGRRSRDRGQIAMAEVRVWDEGRGIAEDELERVFAKFVRGSGCARDAEGVGLGLAICREIVLAHQGSIRAHNRAAGGAEFVVRLPVQVGPGAGVGVLEEIKE